MGYVTMQLDVMPFMLIMDEIIQDAPIHCMRGVDHSEFVIDVFFVQLLGAYAQKMGSLVFFQSANKDEMRNAVFLRCGGAFLARYGGRKPRDILHSPTDRKGLLGVGVHTHHLVHPEVMAYGGMNVIVVVAVQEKPYPRLPYP